MKNVCCVFAKTETKHTDNKTGTIIFYLSIKLNIVLKCGVGMKQPKLKYHFHNPNSPEVSAEYILKILMQVNAVKAENAVKAVLETYKSEAEK